jgi:Predicted metal-dependent hydrolase with the TIM-barrel fold
MSINTVIGPVKAQELGVTAPHEHIMIDSTMYFHEPDAVIRKMQANKKIDSMRDIGILALNPAGMRDNMLMGDIKLQTEEIMEYKKAGGKTVVDLTLHGIGRDVEALKDISFATGLNIVTATGYYVVSSHPAYIKEATVEEIAKVMIDEIHNGIDGTGIKPGVIGEIGTDYIIHPDEIKVLKAAAIAHKNSGLPISVHINPWAPNGLQVLNILDDYKVDHERICICHIDGECRKDYIYELLEKGVYIEFDNFGKQYTVLDIKNIKEGEFGYFVSDRQRIELLCELLEKGFEGQILLSCDVCLKTLLHEYGGWGYDHVLSNIVPDMLYHDVSQKKIDKMLIDNPARFLDT